MKIFISKEPKKVIKKNYKIINKEVSIIDVDNLAQSFSVDDYENNIFAKYVLTQEIEKRFKYSYLSKRFKDILYITKDIDEKTINNLRRFLDFNNIYFTEFILIDYTMTVNPELYSEFQNVI